MYKLIFNHYPLYRLLIH